MAVVTLDQTARGNALSADLTEALLVTLESTLVMPSLHTIVLRGAGKHFCTGFDLSDVDSASDGELLWRFVRIELLLSRIWQAPIRTVAIANGRTWGAGADIFCACDVRMATADASFRFPGAGFGVVLGTRRLSERVGSDVARRWVLTGEQIDTASALGTRLATDRLPAPATGTCVTGLADWVDALGLPHVAVDGTTQAAVQRISRRGESDSDLAALVRSAARPGLADRIRSYRERVRSMPRPDA